MNVTPTIQTITLKIVTNIINLSHGFPNFAFVYWLVAHIVMLRVFLSPWSPQYVLSPAQTGVFFGKMSISPTSLRKYFMMVEPSSGYVFAGLGWLFAVCWKWKQSICLGWFRTGICVLKCNQLRHSFVLSVSKSLHQSCYYNEGP